MSRRVLLGVLFLWGLVGASLAVFAPQDRALGPDQSLFVYGMRRTSFSSAPAGTLAFYRTLELLGFTCSRSATFDLPENGALFVLEPVVWLSDAEARELVRWVDRGGHLIYAPSRVEAHFDEDGRSVAVDVEDPLLARLPSGEWLEAGVWRTVLGRGRVVVLSDLGERLSNEALADGGIATQMGWLRFALDGLFRVHFDEARAGAMLNGGLFSILLSGRYRLPLAVLVLAVALALWAIATRVRPISGGRHRETPSIEGHVRALARMMESERRDALAREALVSGARERFSTASVLLEKLDALDPEQGLVSLVGAIDDLEVGARGL